MDGKPKTNRSAKLTKSETDRAKFEGHKTPAGTFSRDILWDTELKGFGLRIYPSGKKTFVLSYRSRGRKRLMALGTYGRITPDEARKQAVLRFSQLINNKDPIEVRKRESYSGLTLKELGELFLAKHRKRNGKEKKSKAWDERRLRIHINPVIGSLRAASITRDDLKDLHQKIGEHSECEANKCISLLSTIFEFARDRRLIEESFPNPARRIHKFKEISRERWVHPDEMPSLAKAINEERNEFARAALWLYLLTGARKSEILKAKWADLDFKRGTLRLVDTKSDRDHHLPLSKPAIALLSRIPRTKDNEYIIQGKKKGCHLVGIRKIWLKVRKNAGVEDVRIHDLRRTLGSWMVQRGNSLALIGKVLNHSNQDSTQIYARFAQDNVRQALEDHGLEIAKAAFPDVPQSKSVNEN